MQKELLDLQVKAQKKTLEKAAKKEEMQKTVSERMAGTPEITDPRALPAGGLPIQDFVEQPDPTLPDGGYGAGVDTSQLEGTPLGGMIADLEQRSEALGIAPEKGMGSHTEQKGTVPTPYADAGLPAGFKKEAVAGKSLPEIMAELTVTEMSDLGIDLKDALEISRKTEGQEMMKKFLPEEFKNKIVEGTQSSIAELEGAQPIPTPQPEMTIEDIFKKDEGEIPPVMLDPSFHNLTAFDAMDNPKAQELTNQAIEQQNTPTTESGFIPTPTIDDEGNWSVKLVPKSKEVTWVPKNIDGNEVKVAVDKYGNQLDQKEYPPIKQTDRMTEFIPMTELDSITAIDTEGNIVQNLPLNMQRGDLDHENNHQMEFVQISKKNKDRLGDLNRLQKRLDTVGDLSEKVFGLSAKIDATLKQKIFSNIDGYLRLNFEQGFDAATFNRVMGTDVTEQELSEFTLNKTLYDSLQKELGVLARTVSLESGALNEGDIGRAQSFLGKQKGQGIWSFFTGDAPEEANVLFNDLQGYVDNQIQGLIGKTKTKYRKRTSRKITGIGGQKPEGGTSIEVDASFPCWVARAVYGETNPKWLIFREWLFTLAPTWLFKLYIKFGKRFASFIKDKPKIKNIIRHYMDKAIKQINNGY